MLVMPTYMRRLSQPVVMGGDIQEHNLSVIVRRVVEAPGGGRAGLEADPPDGVAPVAQPDRTMDAILECVTVQTVQVAVKAEQHPDHDVEDPGAGHAMQRTQGIDESVRERPVAGQGTIRLLRR